MLSPEDQVLPRTPGSRSVGRAPAVYLAGPLEVALMDRLGLRARGQTCPHKHLLCRCGPPVTRVRDSPVVCGPPEGPGFRGGSLPTWAVVGHLPGFLTSPNWSIASHFM